MSVVPIEDRGGFAVPARGPISPEVMKAQAEGIRELMKSVLVEGVDFGKIPGTPKPTLYQPGAQWLLKWAGYGFRNVQGPIILDRDGRPYGVTYTCSVHLLIDSAAVVATCDGYCGYDEPDREEHTNRYDKLIPRSPWNTVVKMAQKRALVGASLAATAASGLFTQDVEDMRAVEDPEAEFRRHGWAGRVEADETRTRQGKAIKDGKLADEFNAWRKTSGVPAFSAGWHTKKEADAIDAWLTPTAAPGGQETPEAPETPGEAMPAPGDPNCEHEFDETTEDPPRRFCVLCGLIGA